MASSKPLYMPLVKAIQISPKGLHNEEGDRQTVWRKAEKRKDQDSGVEQFIKEPKLNLDRPVRHALRSIFKHGGKVVLTFPGSSYMQVIIMVIYNT